MIPGQSRYVQGTLTRTPNSEGVYNLTVWRTVPAAVGSFTLYIWRDGDRPDTVANRLLGNPSLWWAIFDKNPEIIDPFNVPPGSLVRIPTNPVMGQGTVLQ